MTFTSNLPKGALKDFGITMEHAIKNLSNASVVQHLNDHMQYLLGAAGSRCEVKSYLAFRFLTKMLDHVNNCLFFTSPMIFYDTTCYNINLRDLNNDLKMLIQNNRQLIEDAILLAIKLHGDSQKNLNAIYAFICVLSVSLPCGFTAAAIANVLVRIQTFAIDEWQNLQPAVVNNLHAMIISILTLICWEHRAASLTQYVHSIVELRYEKAPQLNPVSYAKALFVDRNVIETGKEFYFDSLKLRHCLWKRYRLNEELLPSRPCKWPKIKVKGQKNFFKI